MENNDSSAAPAARQTKRRKVLSCLDCRRRKQKVCLISVLSDFVVSSVKDESKAIAMARAQLSSIQSCYGNSRLTMQSAIGIIRSVRVVRKPALLHLVHMIPCRKLPWLLLFALRLTLLSRRNLIKLQLNRPVR